MAEEPGGYSDFVGGRITLVKYKKSTHKKGKVMENNLKESLISKDFFPDGIKIDESNIFPVAVVATMSSGKSTLINALLGKEMLPSSNAACTSLNYSILDDDRKSKEIICVTDTSGKTRIIEENLAEELHRINEAQDVTNVFIRSHIDGVLNTDRALLIIDTPGPNNSRTTVHENVLHDIVKKIRGGVFLYLLNATQLGVYDDKSLLIFLKEIVRKNPEIKIVFAINKVDELDEEYESIQGLVDNAKKYIEDIGFVQPDIIPLSARAALLFKKVLTKQELTRKEKMEFIGLYDLYEATDFNMRKYAITKELKNQAEIIDGTNYSVGDLNQAIANTGITMLESYIQKAQILSSGQIKNTLKVRIK